MRFAKYHGIGNDFVLLTDLDAGLGPAASLPKELVRALCDRHTGVGANGVIRILGPQPGTTLQMDYYNADGGPAEMCGNGIRCLAVLARTDGFLDPGEHTIRTGGGDVLVRVDDTDRVAVDMGIPRLQRPDIPMTGDGSALRVGVELPGGDVVEGTGVSMGNPHFVLFTGDLGRPLTDDLVSSLGPTLERHAAFPQRTNVEFVDVTSRAELTMRVWERGVGETQACGTGACAVAVAAAALKRADRTVRVHLPGGSLDISWGPDDHVWMTGPAEEVFRGAISDGWLAARDLELGT